MRSGRSGPRSRRQAVSSSRCGGRRVGWGIGRYAEDLQQRRLVARLDVGYQRRLFVDVEGMHEQMAPVVGEVG